MTGEQMRRIRKRLGLTQREFAHEMGWHPNSVAKAERGEMTITPMAARLAKLLLAIHQEPTPERKRRRT